MIVNKIQKRQNYFTL